jgi:cytidylate kinase
MAPSLSALAGAAACAPFQRLEAAFRRVIGTDALERLRSRVTPAPVIAVGGHQLTGKSTLSRRLAERAGGSHASAGALFRDIARAKGLTVAQLSRMALADERIDIGIDYRLCEQVADGLAPRRPLVIEGRQPGIMALYMREVHGKKNSVSIFLKCSHREQTLRFVEREFPSHLEAVKQALAEPEYPSLLDAAVAISAIDGELAHAFADNARRDHDDVARYADLYGFDKGISYYNEHLYDIVIDTTPNKPQDTLEQAHSKLRDFLALTL